MIDKILVDTSVWVNFQKNQINIQTELLENYLKTQSYNLYTCPAIIQEFLMGLKHEKEFLFYKFHFLQLPQPDLNWLETSISAAKLYFDLKKKGITIRKSNDCLIAQIAIENNFILVHNDSDFELIASASDLMTYQKV